MQMSKANQQLTNPTTMRWHGYVPVDKADAVNFIVYQQRNRSAHATATTIESTHKTTTTSQVDVVAIAEKVVQVNLCAASRITHN